MTIEANLDTSTELIVLVLMNLHRKFTEIDLKLLCSDVNNRVG